MFNVQYFCFQSSLFKSIKYVSDTSDNDFLIGYFYGIGNTLNDMLNNGIITLEQYKLIDNFIEDIKKSKGVK